MTFKLPLQYTVRIMAHLRTDGNCRDRLSIGSRGWSNGSLLRATYGSDGVGGWHFKNSGLKLPGHCRPNPCGVLSRICGI
jgi:hypothetical protein